MDVQRFMLRLEQLRADAQRQSAELDAMHAKEAALAASIAAAAAQRDASQLAVRSKEAAAVTAAIEAQREAERGRRAQAAAAVLHDRTFALREAMAAVDRARASPSAKSPRSRTTAAIAEAVKEHADVMAALDARAVAAHARFVAVPLCTVAPPAPAPTAEWLTAEAQVAKVAAMVGLDG